MSRKVLMGAVVFGLLAAAVASADDTWYGIQQEFAVGIPQGARTPAQMAEIEVAPGVRVRADIWEDDYVPTYQDLVSVGFLADDADVIVRECTTWGLIKACFTKPDPLKCLADKNNG